LFLLTALCADGCKSQSQPKGGSQDDRAGSSIELPKIGGQETDSGTWTEPPGADCAEGDRRCAGDIVEHCIDGDWRAWEECAPRGLICALFQGEAVCMEAVSQDDDTELVADAGDLDVDSDRQTDTEAAAVDSDADSDNDSDSDSDSDSGEGEGLDIVTNEDGWIDNTTNALGIQGSWHSASDSDYSGQALSHIEMYMDGDKICARGTIVQVVDADDDGEVDWDLIWGAYIGFDLCATGADEVPPEKQYTLSTCPFNENLADELEGIRFDLEGEFGPAEMRLTFSEGESPSAYVVIDAVGTHAAYLEDARIFWDAETPPADNDAVHAVEFSLPADSLASYDFDFCVSKLRALLE
jgi:hypothetical protein